MTFRNVLKLFVLAVVCGGVLVGCTKKPKIDLSGLRTNGVQNGGASGLGDDDGFIPGSGDDDGMGGLIWGEDGKGLNDGDKDNANGGSWSSTDSPLGGGSADNFLAGAQRWDDIVYFAYDRAEVAASERPKIERLAEYLLGNPGTGVVIEGHCDERGSDEYNRALSERRALSVRSYLSSLGVGDERMQTVSFGEDRPAVPNATSEPEHSENRRAEFQFGRLK